MPLSKRKANKASVESEDATPAADGELARLRSQVESLQSERDTLRIALTDAKEHHRKNEELKEQIINLLTGQSDALKTENKRLNDELADLRSQLNNTDRKVSSPKAEPSLPEQTKATSTETKVQKDTDAAVATPVVSAVRKDPVAPQKDKPMVQNKPASAPVFWKTDDSGKQPVPHDALALSLAFSTRTDKSKVRIERLALCNPGTWRDAVVSSHEMWEGEGVFGERHWDVYEDEDGETIELPELLELSLQCDPGRWVRVEQQLSDRGRTALMKTLRNMKATHLDYERVKPESYPGYYRTKIPGVANFHHKWNTKKMDVNLPLLEGLKVVPCDIDQFLRCSALKELVIVESDEHYTFDKFTNLTNFKKLTRLELEGVQISSLHFVEPLSSLRSLTLDFLNSGGPDVAKPLKLPSTLEELICPNCFMMQFPPPKQGPDCECRFLRKVAFGVANLEVIEHWLPLWTKLTIFEMCCSGRESLNLSGILQLKELRELELYSPTDRMLYLASQQSTIEHLKLSGIGNHEILVQVLAPFRSSLSLKQLELIGDRNNSHKLSAAVTELSRFNLNFKMTVTNVHAEPPEDAEPDLSPPNPAFCRNCDKDESMIGKELLKCAKCKVARYCDANCQRQHWKTHKPLCKKPST